MSKIKYKNPPITEALFDIRVEVPKKFDQSKFTQFYEKVKDQYPTKQQHIKWEAAFKLQDDSPPKTQLDSKCTENGLLMRSSSNDKIVQARLDGFTFNKLKPYNGWENFSKEADSLWKEYVEIIKPTSIKRVALRFINLLEIPLPFDDIKDYLLTSPDIAEGMPNAMSDFLLRLVIPEPETGNTLLLHETLDKSKNIPGVFPLIFDIDVFREVNLKLSEVDKLWGIINSLREYKNCVFESTLTEKAKDLIR